MLASVLRKRSNIVLIADKWFADRVATAGVEAIIIPAEETSKNLDSIPELIVSLRKLGANRETTLVALGGGIVQDAVAFVASVYMRGLRWTYFPTTLLAMADSCIGGKSSINVGSFKNLVGTFHPPQAVLIDPTLALTLSDERRIGGLVEAVKICYCRGIEAFQEYIAFNPSPSMSVDEVERVLTCSLLAKKWFIEVDEFDKAERLLLNFGHTFGHAIEGASHFEIEHGVAVGIGILCAIELGRCLGRCYEDVERIQALKEYIWSLLFEIPSLQERIKKLSVTEVLDRFRADKKHGAEFYVVIVVAESGAVELFRLPKCEESLNLVEKAIEKTLGELTERKKHKYQ